MTVVSIRDLGRNPGRVVDEVARTGRPSLVTKNGRPVSRSSASISGARGFDAGIDLGPGDRSASGALAGRSAAGCGRPSPAASMTIDDLSDDESERFWAVLERL